MMVTFLSCVLQSKWKENNLTQMENHGIAHNSIEARTLDVRRLCACCTQPFNDLLVCLCFFSSSSLLFNF